MFEINEIVFDDAMDKMIGIVLSEQKKNGYEFPTLVSFGKGWLKDQEWYKREVWDKAQAILQYENWSEDSIHKDELTERIAKCMDIEMAPNRKQNLLDYRETMDDGKHSLKKLMRENVSKSDEIIYQIFRGEKEEEAFNKAKASWGERYPFLSFLFFLKDRNRFAPVRPRAMRSRFESLGIKTECLARPTWENYMEFLAILREVQQKLRENMDTNAELIDAHSFVWATWVFGKDGMEVDPLPLDFQKAKKDIESSNLEGKDREAMVKVRVNQSGFRKRLLERYGNQCCLNGCDICIPELLIASHIKPWQKSSKSEKVNADNGLLLCANHDRLFDSGLITFEDDGRIRISEQLLEKDRIAANVTATMGINHERFGKSYMEFHRQEIFEKRKDHLQVMT